MRATTILILLALTACSAGNPDDGAPGPAPVAARTPTPAPDVAIRDATAAWSEAASRDDLEAVVAGFTADGAVVGPEFNVRGTDAIRGFFRQQLPGLERIDLTVATVTPQGDSATATGNWVIEFPGGSDGGQYTATWTRLPDGRWLIAHLEVRSSVGM